MTSTLQTNLSIEHGTNANGAYYKFSDGTLICTKSITFNNVSITKAFGDWYESTTTQNFGNWAHAFSAVPSAVIQNNSMGNGKYADVEMLSYATATAIGTAFLMRPTSGTQNCSFHVIGIGRWK